MQEIIQNNHIIQNFINADEINNALEICKKTKLDKFRIGFDIEYKLVSIDAYNDEMTIHCNVLKTLNIVNHIIHTTKKCIAEINMPMGNCNVLENVLLEEGENQGLRTNKLALSDGGYVDFICKADKLNYYFNNVKKNSKIKDLDITNHPSIEKLRNINVSDNIIPFIVQSYYITLYKGLLPLNKGDKLLISIHDDDIFNNKLFIAEFTIHKAKGLVLKFTMALVNLL